MLEEFLRGWVPLSVSIIALGTSGWGILQGPARKNAEALRSLGEKLTSAIEKLDARLDVTEKDVAALQLVVQQLPTANDFHALDKGLTEVRGKIDAISTSQATAERSLTRIENVLIGMSGGKQ